MTVAVANFFLQQGYSTEQVVVLTPYLGQLMELHKAFKKRDSSLQVWEGCGRVWEGLGGVDVVEA